MSNPTPATAIDNVGAILRKAFDQIDGKVQELEGEAIRLNQEIEYQKRQKVQLSRAMAALDEVDYDAFLAGMAAHLNGAHEWTLNQISDWVETQGAKLQPISSGEVANV